MASAMRWSPSLARFRVQLPALAARSLPVLGAIFAAYFLGLYAFVVLSRIDFPYDLEWMEGGTLEHVMRLLEGKPLYVMPSLEFTPFIYAPLYYWVCAPLVALFGATLPVLRALSALSSLGLFVLLYASVVQSTRDRRAGFIACGLFAATYAASAAWLDLARVDALFLCLLMGGVYALLRQGRGHAVVAGLCFAAAALTKQTALIVVAPLCAAAFFTGKGASRFTCGLVTALAFGAATLVLDLRSGGWYRYYVFELPNAHEHLPQFLLGFWSEDLFKGVPFMIALAGHRLVQPQAWQARWLRVAAGVGFLGAAWLSRLHRGGWENVLMPAFLYLAWLSGEAIARKPHAATERKASSAAATDEHAATVVRAPAALLAALVIFQFVSLWYDPTRYIPTTQDRQAGRALVERLAQAPGPVLSPFHVHLPRLAGKRSSAHEMAMTDVYGGDDSGVARTLHTQVRNQIRSGRYGAVLLDGPWWDADLAEVYQRAALPPATLQLRMRSGWRIGPTTLFVQRSKPDAAKRPPRRRAKPR